MKEIILTGTIGEGNATSEAFLNALAGLDLTPEDELLILIDSPGGSVLDGFKIFNAIASLPNKKVIRITSMAASIASLIVMAADVVQMAEVSVMMIHRSSTFIQGNSEMMKQQIGALEAIDKTMVGLFVAKTGLPAEQIEEMLSEETWFTSGEALQLGFIDEIIYNQKSNKMEKKVNALQKIIASLQEPTEPKAVEPKAAAAPTAAEPPINEPPAPPVEPGEEVAEVVSMEEFVSLREEFAAFKEEVMAALQTVATATKQNIDSVEALPQTIEEVVKAKFTGKANAPVGGAGNMGNSPAYHERFAAFRNDMKEIEAKTRL